MIQTPPHLKCLHGVADAPELLQQLRLAHGVEAAQEAGLAVHHHFHHEEVTIVQEELMVYWLFLV